MSVDATEKDPRPIRVMSNFRAYGTSNARTTPPHAAKCHCPVFTHRCLLFREIRVDTSTKHKRILN